MTQGISSVLTFAVGVAVSPVPIIAVILMLFSRRARVNGPLFLLGWVLALSVVSGVVYVIADDGGASTSSTASDTILWGKVVLGVVLLLLAVRKWRSRPAPGEAPEMPKWMSTIDSMAPGKAFAAGVVLAGANPKNLILTMGASASLAQLDLSASDAVVSLVVFVVVASLTIAVPVGYHLLGGESAAAALDRLKDWLGVNNTAVMAVLLLVFGVHLVAQGLPVL